MKVLTILSFKSVYFVEGKTCAFIIVKSQTDSTSISTVLQTAATQQLQFGHLFSCVDVSCKMCWNGGTQTWDIIHSFTDLLLYFSTITLESSMATNLFTCSLLRDTVYFGYRPTSPGKCRKITGYKQSSTAVEGILECANKLNQF